MLDDPQRRVPAAESMWRPIRNDRRLRVVARGLQNRSAEEAAASGARVSRSLPPRRMKLFMGCQAAVSVNTPYLPTSSISWADCEHRPVRCV